MGEREEELQQSWSTINQARVSTGLRKGASLLAALTLMGAVGLSVSGSGSGVSSHAASTRTATSDALLDVDATDVEGVNRPAEATPGA